MALQGFLTRDGVDWNELWYGAVLPATRMYNEDPIDLVNMFAVPIDETYIKLFHRGTTQYELMSEMSKPVQMDIAKGRLLPEPKFWGIGTGWTWKYLMENSAADIAEVQFQLQLEDRDFMRKQSLAPMLEEPGTTAQKWGMWDGNFKTDEGVTTPPSFGVHTFSATHTHYYGTGTPVLSGIQLEDLIAAKFHIKEHGNFGALVGLFSDKQLAQLEQLALPIWDSAKARDLGETSGGLPALPNINKIDNPLSVEVLTGGLRGALMGIDIVQTAYVPDDYFIVAERGKGGLFMQEKANPSAKGLIMFPGESNSYPIVNSMQFRWHKFGVRQRGFAVAVQIGVAAASYSSPTVYVNANY